MGPAGAHSRATTASDWWGSWMEVGAGLGLPVNCQNVTHVASGEVRLRKQRPRREFDLLREAGSHARHPCSTIESGPPPSLVSASVHRDRLGNAEPVQRRPHVHCFGNSVHGESVVPDDNQRRPLGSILSLPRTPLPANSPRPRVTAPHPLTESFDDVAAKERCSATTIRKILDARLRCSGVQ